MLWIRHWHHILSACENNKALSVKNFYIRMQTLWQVINIDKEKSGFKSDPCGTPTLTFFYYQELPLRTTLWYLLCRNDSIRCKRLQSIPLFFSLCKRHLCKTLSNALDKFKKILPISKDGLAAAAVKSLCVKTISWCT